MLPTQVVSARRGKGAKGGGGNAISSLLRSRVPLWVVALAALQILLLCQLYAWLAAATPVAVPAAVNPAAAAAPHTAAAVAAASSSAVLSSEAAAVPPPMVGVAISYPTTGEPLEVRATGAFERRPPAFASHGPDGGIFFSIVVAAYNQGKFLEETMKSIFGQAYDRWEVIIVNDGSTDTTWEVTLQLLMRHDASYRLMAVRKRNGGLADARNVGMRYARGDWLCMLDSDDLLDARYLQAAATLAAQAAAPPTSADAPPRAMVDIVPGCMRNFDAVSNDWCFPEGWSITGVAHWNKFHASVLQRRALMERVGGYDPSIPWGLEDWNYWLHAAVHNPLVRYVPSLTFWYRHHAGTSMRKKMFASYLELTKAMVRTNHASLYEPDQLLRDHDVIAAMDDETLRRLEEKMELYPGLPKPHLWRALRLQRLERHADALKDLQAAITLDASLAARRGRDDPYAEWQALYRAALSAEKLGAVSQALELVDRAMAGCYHDALQSLKHRLEVSGAHARPGSLPAQAVPSYWGNAKEEGNIRGNTLAGKLAKLASSGAGQLARERREGAMVALLRATARAPCLRGSLPSPDGVNLLQNAHFREGNRGWKPFGDSGFAVSPPPDNVPRPGAPATGSVIMLHSDSDAGSAGASQHVTLAQHVAEPVLLRAWSKGMRVGGSPDASWSLYVDVTFVDGTHEWGYNLPFDTTDGGWQLRTAYLDRPTKPISSLEVYCMLRGKAGTAYFADVVVAQASRSACACPEGQVYVPSSAMPCAPCPPGASACLLGEPLFDAQAL